MKKILKYIVIFFVTLFSLFMIQNIVIRIPNSLIHDNLVESLDFYDNKKNIESIISDSNHFDDSLSFHYYSDCITLNMINNIDSINSFESQVLMQYYTKVNDTICESLEYSVLNDVEPNNEYSRYWHGSIIFIKPLLLFTNVKTIKVIFCCIFAILLCYLIYLILRKSPIIAILFSLSLVFCMFYIVPICFEYFFAFLIMIIASIIVMKNLDKDDNFFYKLFVVTGVCVCFFDFLTYEVLTIMLPLFLKIYFDNYQKEKIDFKKNLIFIVKCIIIWGLSYAFTFLCKWIISAIVLGPKQFLSIWNSAKLRIYDTSFDKRLFFLQAIIKIASMIFPFSLFDKAPIYFIIYCLFVLYIFVFNISKEKRQFLGLLLLISLIGVLRLVVLFAHTWGHYFFDYRNLMPFILWTFVVLYQAFAVKRK